MSTISVQFHARPQELLDFVAECVREAAVKAVLMWRLPRFGIAIAETPEAVESIAKSRGMPAYVRLSTSRPVLTVTSEDDFLRKNPDSLMIDVGEESAAGLQESFLGAKTEDAEAMRLWRRLAARWKRRTLRGATAINARTGVRGTVKEHRFTVGARDLASTGVRMWALGKKSYLEFEQNATS